MFEMPQCLIMLFFEILDGGQVKSHSGAIKSQRRVLLGPQSFPSSKQLVDLSAIAARVHMRGILMRYV